MIDYGILQKFIDSFKNLNYNYIDVPWIVPEHAYAETTPFKKDSEEYYHNRVGYNHYCGDNFLVASGEQSFIHLMYEKKLNAGEKYCAVTPCFRTETTVNLINKHYFTKLELFCIPNTDGDVKKTWYDFLFDAKSTLENILNLATAVRRTPDGFDLIDVDSGIELGSYGYRKSPVLNTVYVYGTGLALDRAMYVHNLQLKG